MSQNNNYDPKQKTLGKDKLSRIPVKIENTAEPLRKPDWIRIQLKNSDKVENIKTILRENKLHTVC